MVPFYSNVTKVPSYYGVTPMDVDSNSFYWASRLLGVMADAHYGRCGILIERYQDAVANASRALLERFDKEVLAAKDKKAALEEANEAIAKMAKEETTKALNAVVFETSCQMKNGFSRSDN